MLFCLKNNRYLPQAVPLLGLVTRFQLDFTLILDSSNQKLKEFRQAEVRPSEIIPKEDRL